MWRGAVVSLLLPGLYDPAPWAELPQTPPFAMFTQTQNVRDIFDCFSSHNIFVTLCLLFPELVLLLSLLFSPFTGWNYAILFHKCNQLHKNLSWFPSSQLVFISSSFEPHCALLYLLWHLIDTFILCYDCLILSIRLWTSWGQVLNIEKVLTKYLLNWVPDFLLSAGYSINVLHQTLCLNLFLVSLKPFPSSDFPLFV